MGIFRDPSVFDPDYIPDVVEFRDGQMRELKSCIEPVFEGHAPLNVLCTGPPSTGKTLTIKLVTSELTNVAYVRCLKYREPFPIYSKIHHDLLGVEPPSAGKSRAAVINKVWQNLDMPAIIVLDDLNFLSPKYASEVLYEILKAPEEWGGSGLGLLRHQPTGCIPCIWIPSPLHSSTTSRYSTHPTARRR